MNKLTFLQKIGLVPIYESKLELTEDQKKHARERSALGLKKEDFTHYSPSHAHELPSHFHWEIKK